MNITTLRNAIHDDADAIAWCTANYGRAHNVYVSFDDRNPPGEESYPIVFLFPISKTGGYALEDQDHVVSAVCGLYNEDIAKETGYPRVTEMEGVGHLEIFRKYVETAIVNVIPAGYFINLLEIEYETIDTFPYFMAAMVFTITWSYSQGDDVFA